MVSEIGQNDKEGIPVEDRKVYVLMIYTKYYALVTEIDFKTGDAFGFIRDSEETVGKWDKMNLADMMDGDWLTLEFNEPMSFGEAITIGEEYYIETSKMEDQMKAYGEYTNGLQKKVKKVNL